MTLRREILPGEYSLCGRVKRQRYCATGPLLKSIRRMTALESKLHRKNTAGAFAFPALGPRKTRSMGMHQSEPSRGIGHARPCLPPMMLHLLGKTLSDFALWILELNE